MAHVVEGLSLAGLRKAHLRQLACYIRNRDTEGWYYGPRDQFEKRHADLLRLAEQCDEIANDASARLPNRPGSPAGRGERSSSPQPSGEPGCSGAPAPGQPGRSPGRLPAARSDAGNGQLTGVLRRPP